MKSVETTRRAEFPGLASVTERIGDDMLSKHPHSSAVGMFKSGIKF